jgi:hypothetical protein
MSSQISSGFKYPFGEESFEHEIEVLQDQYRDFYYNQGRFNAEILDPDTYLIIGRRGSGKSSLAKYLEFQDSIKNARLIDVNEPEIYEETLRQIIANTNYPDDLLTSRIVKLWNYIIWSLILDSLREVDPVIGAACILSDQKNIPGRIVSEVLKKIAGKTIGDSVGSLVEQVESYLASSLFKEAKTKVLAHVCEMPVIIAIDTLERYDRNDEQLMCATAALIQSSSEFSISYAGRGIHIKAFIAAEVFPHIKEAAIANTTKYIRYPMYLHWRPKDLVRLICWRLKKYLDGHHLFSNGSTHVNNWNDFDGVIHKIWTPFFGSHICNEGGTLEKSFPYVLRHTQMRPRQLVVLCNAIAKRAMQNESFPFFKSESIASIVKETEGSLADEVINSYARIYPRVGEVLEALQTSPMTFEGSYLDQVAKRTSYAWPARTYSLDNFRKLVAELGIVGRMRKFDEESGIMQADFEYAQTDRLPLRSNDVCVIHPMFYSKLRTKIERKVVVYPFPDHPDFDELHVDTKTGTVTA